MSTDLFTLQRDPFGRLILRDQHGVDHVGVAPLRAFPIQAPNDGIAMVRPDGREVAWIDQLSDLPSDLRTLIATELERREFMPEIRSITRVTSFSTPCTWYVDTDRGSTHFVLRGEEDVRRIGQTGLLISDNHGIHFLIRDLLKLDKSSRKILDRFL